MNIVALSSDYRDSYKADIYRALSLPSGSLLHFRYKKKYVDDVFFESKKDVLKGERIIIFLQTGNRCTDSDTKINIPIRSGMIEDFFYEETTEVFHIYMKLNHYVKYKKNKTLKGSEGWYLYTINKDLVEKATWHDVIETIKHTSLNTPDIFFCIKGIVKKNKTIHPKIDSANFTSYYELGHDTNYSIEISIAKKEESKHKLSLDFDKDILQINSPTVIDTSVPYDDINIPLETNQISRKTKNTSIKITPLNERDETLHLYTSIMSVTLRRNFSEAAKFSLFTILIILGLGLAKYVFDEFSKNEKCFINICEKTDTPSIIFLLSISLLSFILVFVGTALSYHKFNKR